MTNLTIEMAVLYLCTGVYIAILLAIGKAAWIGIAENIMYWRRRK